MRYMYNLGDKIGIEALKAVRMCPFHPFSSPTPNGIFTIRWVSPINTRVLKKTTITMSNPHKILSFTNCCVRLPSLVRLWYHLDLRRTMRFASPEFVSWSLCCVSRLNCGRFLTRRILAGFLNHDLGMKSKLRRQTREDGGWLQQHERLGAKAYHPLMHLLLFVPTNMSAHQCSFDESTRISSNVGNQRKRPARTANSPFNNFTDLFPHPLLLPTLQSYKPYRG